MKRRRTFLMALLVAAALAAVFLLVRRRIVASKDPTWDRVQKSGVLRVGLDPSFPPFESDDGRGGIAGLDVDLAHALARSMGVSAKIEPIGFDSLLDALWTKRVDVVISAMPMDYTKSKDVTYSRPYFDAGQYLVIRRGEKSIRSVKDLNGRPLAVEWGSEGDALARQLRTKMPGMRLVLKEGPNAALQAVVSGEADVALVDGVSARMFSGPICVLTPSVSPTSYVVVMPKRAPRLSDAVNRTLAEMEESGALQALVRKWMYPPGEDPEKGCPKLEK